MIKSPSSDEKMKKLA